jgi:hypothetical protein
MSDADFEIGGCGGADAVDGGHFCASSFFRHFGQVISLPK